MAKMAKAGKPAAPVVLTTRKITTTFWGQAWCDNLEAYSDFANRLPRGRTYIRNGSVIDLQITKGKVTALVSGSELYRIEIQIKPLATKLWKNLQADCAGKIDSLIELLQGRLSAGVMQIVTRRAQGLFPSPKEITLSCSCPDWAEMCKHVAASLYGVGARLDEQPALLFLLRGVDPEDLISKVSAADAVRPASPSGATAALGEAELADVFGIEIAPAATPPAGPAAAPPEPAPRRKSRLAKKPAPAAPRTRSLPAKEKKSPAQSSKPVPRRRKTRP